MTDANTDAQNQVEALLTELATGRAVTKEQLETLADTLAGRVQEPAAASDETEPAQEQEPDATE